jgi:hypothetical protein
MTPLSRRPPPAAFRLYHERLVSDPTLCQRNLSRISAGWLSMPLDAPSQAGLQENLDRIFGHAVVNDVFPVEVSYFEGRVDFA